MYVPKGYIYLFCSPGDEMINIHPRVKEYPEGMA